jgi:hypothetical protein
MQSLRSATSAMGRIGRAALCGGLLTALSLLSVATPAAAAEADAVGTGSEVAGQVVSVSGAAYAQSPGQARRILSCLDPIYQGDRILTQESSALGVVSGDHYTQVGENTQLVYTSTGDAAPQLEIETGHVRLLDVSGRAPTQAGISTPGLVAARSGRDTEALVFAGEKIGVVSMACAFEDPVQVARRGDPDQTAVADPGSCIVSKPREELYRVPATHPRLAVSTLGADDGAPLLAIGSHFNPAQVALGAGILGAPVAASEARGLLMRDPLEPCSVGVNCGLGEPPVEPPPSVFPGTGFQPRPVD